MGIIEKAKDFAKVEYAKNDSLHQWGHIEAVMKRAFEICENIFGVDLELLQLAIIFHDIDYAAYETHVEASMVVAEKFLVENNYPAERILKVKEIMLNHSTPHRRKVGEAKLIEGKIIYDADKSLTITDSKTYSKYFPRLYLEETRKLVPKFDN